MNEVSIIINRVRYDAVECKVGDECVTCDLYHVCKEHSFPLGRLCNIIPQKEGNTFFKKSDKKFER